MPTPKTLIVKPAPGNGLLQAWTPNGRSDAGLCPLGLRSSAIGIRWNGPPESARSQEHCTATRDLMEQSLQSWAMATNERGTLLFRSCQKAPVFLASATSLVIASVSDRTGVCAEAFAVLSGQVHHSTANGEAWTPFHPLQPIPRETGQVPDPPRISIIRNSSGLLDVVACCRDGIFRAEQTGLGVFRQWHAFHRGYDKRGTVIQDEPTGVAVFISGDEWHSRPSSALPAWKRVL